MINEEDKIAIRDLHRFLSGWVHTNMHQKGLAWTVNRMVWYFAQSLEGFLQD